MTVKNIVLAVTLVVGSTSLALAQTHTRIGPAGVHRAANVGLAQRPLARPGRNGRRYAGARARTGINGRRYAAARMYRRANGPLISAPVGLTGGAAAYQGYGAYQGNPGARYQDN